MENDNNSESLVTPPGPQLKKAREAADLTLEQAAEHLKITVNYIRALEEDDHEKLPDRPYVQGYLRAYSRLLSIDTESVLEDYNAYFSGVAAPTESKTGRADRASGSSGLSKKVWLLLIVAVLLIWAGAVALFSGNQDSQANVVALVETEATEVVVAPQIASPDVALLNTDESLQASAPAADSSVGEGDADIANETAEEKVPQAVSENAVEEPEVTTSTTEVTPEERRDSLSFAFTGECWLEVTDANGDVLAADLFQAGDTFEAEGEAPFDVMMGDVRLVSLSLNGELYDLKPNGFRKTLRTVVE